MGMCQPSGGINPSIIGKIGSSIPKAEGEPPNSRTDMTDSLGNPLQSRWYGPDGRAIWDRDFNHKNPNNNHKFPHDHRWDWSKKLPRQKDNLEPDYENFCTEC